MIEIGSYVSFEYLYRDHLGVVVDDQNGYNYVMVVTQSSDLLSVRISKVEKINTKPKFLFIKSRMNEIISESFRNNDNDYKSYYVYE